MNMPMIIQNGENAAWSITDENAAWTVTDENAAWTIDSDVSPHQESS